MTTQPPRSSPAAARRSQTAALCAAVGILLITGLGHRLLLGQVDRALGQTVQPRQPLDTLPMDVGPWHGHDVPVDPRVLKAAHFDDLYVSRVYRHAQLDIELSVFVGYVGRPRSWLGHRPDRCVVAHGWKQTAQEPLTIPRAAGRPVSSVLYEFRPDQGFGNTLLVVGTYIMNGRYEQKTESFKQPNARAANLLGERPAYFARLQISRMQRDHKEDLAALQELTAALAGPLEERMPYWDAVTP
jgi:hypothetical protein